MTMTMMMMAVMVVCVCVCEAEIKTDRQRENRKEGEAFLAVFQIVDDPGDGLLSCGANVTLQRGREGGRDGRDMGGGVIRNKELAHHLSKRLKCDGDFLRWRFLFPSRK